MNSCIVTLPLRIVSEVNGSHGHWAAKAKRRKEQRFAIALACRGPLQKAAITLPCRVTFTRIAPRAFDCDNLAASFKACRDSMAELLGVDDRDPRVAWRYQQERGEPKTYAVRIVVEDALEAAS